MTLIRIISILCLGIFLSGQASNDGNLDEAFDKDSLIIEASKHACYRFDVYLATSRAQQTRGLMFVRHLPELTGMLFVYPQQRLISMWMKNTYIPLDILFIRADGTIANIARNTVPLSLDSIVAIEPLNFALEVNAGLTERLAIDTDSRVYFPDL
ncbi:MAG: DUF192 domain-containing protein [Woeseiaceae bacterium]|nr:DUF192 domain-containing protein [Woeseiaceae bacterium]